MIDLGLTRNRRALGWAVTAAAVAAAALAVADDSGSRFLLGCALAALSVVSLLIAVRAVYRPVFVAVARTPQRTTITRLADTPTGRLLWWLPFYGPFVAVALGASAAFTLCMGAAIAAVALAGLEWYRRHSSVEAEAEWCDGRLEQLRIAWPAGVGVAILFAMLVGTIALHEPLSAAALAELFGYALVMAVTGAYYPFLAISFEHGIGPVATRLLLGGTWVVAFLPVVAFGRTDHPYLVSLSAVIGAAVFVTVVESARRRAWTSRVGELRAAGMGGNLSPRYG